MKSSIETRLLTGDAQGIAQAVAALAEGDAVALPTETVYGLAARALDARACAGIFEAKQRPLHDPLIVHIPSLDWLSKIAEVSPEAILLAERHWPGPLTLILKKRDCIPDIVTAGQETVAVRMSAHPLFSQVITALGEPLAAPSANRFGRISPTCAAHVVEELGGRIGFILDGGNCSHGIESTIYHVAEKRILRPGPIGPKELGTALTSGEGKNTTVVPGSLPGHYAPKTKLTIVGENFRMPPSTKRVGCLQWRGGMPQNPEFAAVEILSPSGDLREAAGNTYIYFRVNQNTLCRSFHKHFWQFPFFLNL